MIETKNVIKQHRAEYSAMKNDKCSALKSSKFEYFTPLLI